MKKVSAFTLIELMIGMSIIAILATAGLSAYSGYIKKSRDTARASAAKQLNTAVTSYMGSSGGTPPANSTAFDQFLQAASDMLPRGADINNGIAVEDPAGGKSVCLDANGIANQPCVFHYSAYSDGTYAISYGVETSSSTKTNFYKTTNSVAHPSDSNNPPTLSTTKYGVYIGTAPYIGGSSATSNTSAAADTGVTRTFMSPKLSTAPTMTFKSNGAICTSNLECSSGWCKYYMVFASCAQGYTCADPSYYACTALIGTPCSSTADCTGADICKSAGSGAPTTCVNPFAPIML